MGSGMYSTFACRSDDIDVALLEFSKMSFKFQGSLMCSALTVHMSNGVDP
jgi:hypothetical protein